MELLLHNSLNFEPILIDFHPAQCVFSKTEDVKYVGRIL